MGYTSKHAQDEMDKVTSPKPKQSIGSTAERLKKKTSVQKTTTGKKKVTVANATGGGTHTEYR